MRDKTSFEIASQYKAWPYPHIPLLASIPREQLWQINVEWMLKKAGLPLPEEKCKIWITGCGTFQPYTFSQANPSAKILATDLSEASLKTAKLRCALHFNRNVVFQSIDLENEWEYPNEKFDFIECYGVLMNLKDPGTVLSHLAKRLGPNGMLRVMVYPHYGRQRIFQIQRLAKLLGLSSRDNKDPKRLRNIMGGLPQTHPLRSVFFSYQDSKTESGIVDAFLHAGDRAFTGTEICQMIEAAGLTIAYTMHRPWGQPRQMGKKLGLAGKDTAYLLNYLDVWQSLKTNFILNLTHRNAEQTSSRELNRHPLFCFSTSGIGLKYRTRLVRMALTGTRLQTRTYDGPRNLGASAVRQVLIGEKGRNELERDLLSPKIEGPLSPLISSQSQEFKPTPHWVVREGGPNPLEAHLHDSAFFKEGNWQLLGEERIAPSTNYLLFSEAGHLLTNERQRSVYKKIDGLELKRRTWEKGELLELWYLFNLETARPR